jgi:hypothetical protein
MKQIIEDPVLGTKAFWVSRLDSAVTVENNLRIWNDTYRTEDTVFCTLRLPRALLTDLIPKPSQEEGPPGVLPAILIERSEDAAGLYTLAIWAALAVWKVVRQGPPTRKQTLSVEVTTSPSVRLVFPRTSLPVFARFFTNRVPNLPFRPDEEGHASFEEEMCTAPPLWEAALTLDPTASVCRTPRGSSPDSAEPRPGKPGASSPRTHRHGVAARALARQGSVRRPAVPGRSSDLSACRGQLCGLGSAVSPIWRSSPGTVRGLREAL